MEQKAGAKRQAKEDSISCREYANALPLPEAERERVLETCLTQSTILSGEQRARIRFSCDTLSDDPRVKQKCIGFKILNPNADAQIILHPSLLPEIATCESGRKYAPNSEVAHEFMDWCLAQLPPTLQSTIFFPHYDSDSFYTPQSPEENWAKQLVDSLIREKKFDKLFLFLELSSSLGHTTGKKPLHKESIYIHRRVEEIYKKQLDIQDAGAHQAWNKNLDWAQNQGYITGFTHGGGKDKIKFTKRGGKILEILDAMKINRDSLEKMVEKSLLKEEWQIKKTFLLYGEEKSRLLKKEYHYTNQYFNIILKEMKKQKELLKNFLDSKSVAELQGLDEIIIGLFIKEVPISEIAKEEKVPLIYIEILSPLSDLEITEGEIKEITGLLNVPVKHIKFLKYLYRDKVMKK